MDAQVQYLVDRVAVIEVGARATRLLNDGRIDEYCDLYTDDGVFHAVGYDRVIGKAAIAAAMRLAAGVIHMTLDHVVEIDADVARAECNLIAGWARIDHADTGFLESGQYRDTLVRTDTGWKMTERVVSLDVSPASVFARLTQSAGDLEPERWRESRAGRWANASAGLPGSHE